MLNEWTWHSRKASVLSVFERALHALFLPLPAEIFSALSRFRLLAALLLASAPALSVL